MKVRPHPAGPWERLGSGGWTSSPGGPLQLPECQPALPSAPPTWVLGAPSSLERERGRSRSPSSGGWAQGCSSLPPDFQELTCSPSPPLWGLGAGSLAPLQSCSYPTKVKIRGRVRWGPRRLPSQAAPQQAPVQTLPRRPVLVLTARSQQWSDKKDKVGE